MKKLIPLMALALVILVGCAKEEITTAALSTADQQVEESSVWVMNTDGDSPVWEAVTSDELQSTQSYSGSSATSRSNSAHTHGDLAFNVYSLSWSGTENNGGPHGSAIVEQTWSGGIAQFILETACVSVEGNEAVYVGIITEAINPPPAPPPPPPCPSFPNCPPPPPNPYSVGNSVFFKVIDNGQGNNAPSDQHSTGVFFTSVAVCPTPSSGIWSLPFLTILDVEAPGSVKVN